MTNPMTKAGEQPTITQALADDLDAAFKRHSMASSYDIQARVYEVANICLQNRKEILNALRTTSLAAQDGLVEALEFYADHENWWGTYCATSKAPMADDWSDPTDDFPDGKPGKIAREALAAIKGDNS